MGRNGESGAFGLAAARGGVAAAGVGARFARFGTGIGIGAGTSNVASEPLRDRTEGVAVEESHVSVKSWIREALAQAGFENTEPCTRANAIHHGSSD